jgi:sigma-B regulation protein RsbU (phosphoserine phosphatase)
MTQEHETILVVDDEPVNAMVLKGILGKAGFGVLTAESGPEGRELARQRHPSLVLLDVMMPEETGFDTCMKLKQDPGTAGIPVIFLTCLDDVTSKITGLNLGAVDYITKPFHAQEVLARIRAHLGFRKAQDEIIAEQANRLGQIQSAQRAMLVTPAEAPRARFVVHYVPVLEAGGDFYDVIEFPDGRVGYFVADVSGHDLGASFITSSLKALFRQNAAPEHGPADTLLAMNRVLRTITPEEMYLTAAYAILDRAGGRLSLANAGHPPAVFVPPEGEPEVLESSGDVIGSFDRIEVASMEHRVAPGARLFLYTDGLTEPTPGRVTAVGESLAALRAACGETRSLPVADAVRGIVERVVGKRPLADDVVLLGIEV